MLIFKSILHPKIPCRNIWSWQKLPELKQNMIMLFLLFTLTLIYFITWEFSKQMVHFTNMFAVSKIHIVYVVKPRHLEKNLCPTLKQITLIG